MRSGEGRGEGGAASRRSGPASGAIAFGFCLAVLLATPSYSFWINDCGNKALLSQRLLETGFRDLDFDYPAAALDPQLRAFPIPPPFATPRGGGFVSAYPPAYSALAAPFLWLLGPLGLRIPAALGVGACAWLFALWASPALGARRALAGGLVLALATPLFFYGVTVWEHSITVALGLGAWVLASRGTPSRLLAAGLLAAAACWFREELALMVAALALATFVQTRRAAPVGWLAAGAAAPIGALLIFNHWAYGTPLGAHVAANLASDAAASALSGRATASIGRALVSLLACVGKGNREVALLGAAAVAAPLLGYFAARRSGAAAYAVLPLAALGLAAWGFGLARMIGAHRPLEQLVRYNGLLVQMPMFCLAGVGLRRLWERPEYAELRVGALAGATFLALALLLGVASDNGFGAQTNLGVHWGPRVLLPALPALVALALTALPLPTPLGARALTPWLRRSQRIAWALLATAGLLSSAHAAWFLAQQKLESQRFQSSLRGLGPRFTVTAVPILAQHLSRLWDEKPMLLVEGPQALQQLVGVMRGRSVREFLFIAPAGAAPLAGIRGLDCQVAERHRGRHLHYLELDIQRCTLRPRGRRLGLLDGEPLLDSEPTIGTIGRRGRADASGPGSPRRRDPPGPAGSGAGAPIGALGAVEREETMT